MSPSRFFLHLSTPPTRPPALLQAMESERTARQRLQDAADRLQADAARARAEAERLANELSAAKNGQVCVGCGH